MSSFSSAASSGWAAAELRFASSSVQGRRPYNEDRCCSRHPLPAAAAAAAASPAATSFFAVFDGHGGEEAAEWCSRHLPDCIASQAEYGSEDGDRCAAIDKGFSLCDSRLRSQPIGSSGSTCGCVLIDSAFIYSGNCGDTRCLLSRVDGPAVELSVDHKPTDPAERRRIEAGGGVVTVNEISVGRNGKKQTVTQAYVELGDAGLAVSRAFGDLSFKQRAAVSEDEQVVICRPHVSRWPRTPEDEFVLLASDGLWNFVDNARVVQFVRERLSSSDGQEADLDDIACKLAQFALDKKSNDNVTVTLVVFPTALQQQQQPAAGSAKQPQETKTDPH